MEISKKDVAKLIAKSLRHDPDSLNLELDSEGWVHIEDILEGFDSHTPYLLDLDDIEDAVTQSNYGRFEFDEKRLLVRALKGHTTSQVSYQVAEPVGNMYRAISSRHADYIVEMGFRSTKRKYTQFFINFSEAIEDGEARGIKDVCLICVNSEEAYHEGTLFYLHEEEWYLQRVDPIHLEVLDC